MIPPVMWKICNKNCTLLWFCHN